MVIMMSYLIISAVTCIFVAVLAILKILEINLYKEGKEETKANFKELHEKNAVLHEKANDRISALSSEVSHLHNRYEFLNGRLDVLTDTVEKHRQGVESLKEGLDKLTGKFEIIERNQKEDEDITETKVSNLRNHIDHFYPEIGVIKERLQKLETLHSNLQPIQKQIDTLVYALRAAYPDAALDLEYTTEELKKLSKKEETDENGDDK